MPEAGSGVRPPVDLRILRIAGIARLTGIGGLAGIVCQAEGVETCTSQPHDIKMELDCICDVSSYGLAERITAQALVCKRKVGHKRTGVFVCPERFILTIGSVWRWGSIKLFEDMVDLV